LHLILIKKYIFTYTHQIVIRNIILSIKYHF